MKIKENRWLIIILTLATLIRFWGFADWSFSNDELSALFRLDFDSISALVKGGVMTDVHPITTQIFLYYWVYLFGYSIVAVRLPFVIFSILGLFYFYKTAAIWVNKKAALLAIAVLSATQYYVLYGTVARPYSIGFFLLFLFSYFWSKLLFQGSRKKSTYIGFVVVAALCIMTHYFAALSIVIQISIGFFILDRTRLKHYLLIILSIILICLPHLGITLHHLSLKGLNWLTLADKNFLPSFFHFFFNHSTLWMFIVLFAPLIAIAQRNFNWNIKKYWALPLLFILPISIGYLYSYFFSPVLQRTTLVFSFPFFILFIFSFFSKEEAKLPFYIYLTIVLSIGLISLNTSANYYNGVKPFANFQGVVDSTISITNRFKQEGVLNFSNNSTYSTYYIKRKDSTFHFDWSQFNNSTDIAKAISLIQNTQAKYICISFAMSPVPPEIHEYVLQHFGSEIRRITFFNSDLRLYKRGEINRRISYKLAAVDNPTKNIHFSKSILVDTPFHSPPYSLKITKSNEFPIGSRTTVGALCNKKNRWMNVGFWLNSQDTNQFLITINVKRNDSTIYWRGYDCRGFYKPNQWYYVERTLERPNEVRDNDQLSISVWNLNKDSAYLDDFSIRNFADSDYDYLKNE